MYVAKSATGAALKQGFRNPETETETDYGVRERRFQATDWKKNVSNDNKITKQIKKKRHE